MGQLQVRKIKNPGDGWWELYNNVNVLKCHWTVQLNKVNRVCFLLCEFYHNKKLWKEIFKYVWFFKIKNCLNIKLQKKNTDTKLKRKMPLRLPWWLSGKEPTCQCRRRRLSPWSGETPHAVVQLGPSITTIKPVLYSPGVTTEVTTMRSPRITTWEWPLLAATREKPVQ